MEFASGEVRKAIEFASNAHGEFPTNPSAALDILVEEVGEVSKEVGIFRKAKNCTEENLALAGMKFELGQVAAVAMMWLEKIHQEEKDRGIS